MPFIANSTYYFDIFFEDKNLSYDVYYSETNPTDLDLSNPTYLKKSLTYLELVYSREVLPQSGYLWIKEQTHWESKFKYISIWWHYKIYK